MDQRMTRKKIYNKRIVAILLIVLTYDGFTRTAHHSADRKISNEKYCIGFILFQTVNTPKQKLFIYLTIFVFVYLFFFVILILLKKLHFKVESSVNSVSS